MTAPLHDTAETTVADVTADIPAKAIEGRSPGRIAWMRLKRDKVALAGGVIVVFLILVAIFAPSSSAPSVTRRTTSTRTRSTRSSAPPPASGAASAGITSSAWSRSTAATSSAASSTARGSPCWWPSCRRSSRSSSAPSSASWPVTSAAGSTPPSAVSWTSSWPSPAALHHVPGLGHAELAAGLQRHRRAHGRPGGRDRVLRLALRRAHRPRPDAEPEGTRVRRRGPQPRCRPRLHPLPGTPAQPRRPDHRLRDADDPDEHPHRGRPELPRGRREAAHLVVGTDALQGAVLLRDGPDLHADPGSGHLHHRARLQPLR